nr:hypothetical protein CFP56_57874 [Quercus suber]
MTPVPIGTAAGSGGDEQMTPVALAPPPSRSSSLVGSTKFTHAINVQRITSAPATRSMTMTTTTGVSRKKLPWLEANNKPKAMHGAADVPEQEKHISQPKLSGSNPTIPLQMSSPTLSNGDSVTERPLIRPTQQDPAFRAIGSSPIPHRRAETRKSKPLSLTSESRPGMRPPRSRLDAREIIKAAHAKPIDAEKLAEYTPSEYSSTGSVIRNTLTPSSLKRGVPSYGRSVKLATARKHSHGPFRAADRRRPHGQQGTLHALPRKPIPVGQNDITDLDLQTVNTSIVPEQQQQQLDSSIRSAPNQVPKVQRKETLFEMPTHLVSSSASSITPHHSVSNTELRDMPAPWTVESSPMVHAVTTLPSQAQHASPPPIPPRSPRREANGMNSAVTGLEQLMADAIMTARNAARSDGETELLNILNSASQALDTANTVNKAMTQPLVHLEVTDSSDSDMSELTISDNLSPLQSREGSTDTTPTIYTHQTIRRPEPVLTEQYMSDGRRAISEHVIIQKVDEQRASDVMSIASTPRQLYQSPSADSIVRDFAYARNRRSNIGTAEALDAATRIGAAADYYGDTGQSVTTQPGVRLSIIAPTELNKPLPQLPSTAGVFNKPVRGDQARHSKFRGDTIDKGQLRELEPVPATAVPVHRNGSPKSEHQGKDSGKPRKRKSPHVADFFEQSYYHIPSQRPQKTSDPQRKASTVTDTRYDHDPSPDMTKRAVKLVRLVHPGRIFYRPRT